MKDHIGNYARHAPYWDWSKLDHDRTPEDEYWYQYAKKYGNNVLIPMCALGETGAYMACRGIHVTAFDITPEMITEGQKRFGDMPGLQLFVGDVRDFRFEIPPVDFCFVIDFGHILTIDDIKKSLACINDHLRDGGRLVIETTLPPVSSHRYPLQTYTLSKQVYPGLKVWKTGEGWFDADTGRHYISQKFYIEDSSGNVESFDHDFYIQSYSREQWLEALDECGYKIAGEYKNRQVEYWQSGSDRFWILEAVKIERMIGRRKR
jgi:SAM-dependent methyltransferase